MNDLISQKLLQYLSVFQEVGVYYIRLCLWLNNNRYEFKMQIDNFTYNGLSKISCDSFETVYRLSFNSYFDSAKNTYYSTIYKVIENNSVKICFPSSETFVLNLNWIKNQDPSKLIEMLHPTEKSTSEILFDSYKSIDNSFYITTENKSEKNNKFSFNNRSAMLFASILYMLTAIYIFIGFPIISGNPSSKAESSRLVGYSQLNKTQTGNLSETINNIALPHEGGDKNDLYNVNLIDSISNSFPSNEQQYDSIKNYLQNLPYVFDKYISNVEPLIVSEEYFYADTINETSYESNLTTSLQEYEVTIDNTSGKTDALKMYTIPENKKTIY